MPRELSKCFSIRKVPRPKGPVRPIFMGQPGVAVEIGCGVGLHPIRWAQANPERKLVAIEHTTVKYTKFARRLTAHPEITNIYPVHADAVSWLSHCVGPEEVDDIYLLYPNPHFKTAQQNLRWHYRPFMRHLVDILCLGGQLTLATNIVDYAEQAKKTITEVWGLRLAEERSWNVELGPRSHFEKKYLARNELCLNLIFEK